MDHKIQQEGSAHHAVNELDKLKEQDLGEFESELKEFHVTDGKSRDDEEIAKVRALEQLVGIAQSNPFGTIDQDVFDENLKDMTKTDLQNMCIKAGVMPRSSSAGMQEALAKEFKRFCQRHGTSMPTAPQNAIDPNSAEYKELMKIINN